MTEEEKKAIETLKDWKDYNIKNKNKILEADKIISTQETILNLIEKLQEENKQLKNAVAVANKLEERIKEDFIPKEKIENIIEKINVYKKLTKEELEQIADRNSLENGRMQAHSVDMSMLQELLKKLESEDK